MQAYLDNVQDTARASALFAPNGALELPYLEALGRPWRAEGPPGVKAFLDGVHERLENFHFHNAKIFIDTPEQVYAEYEVTAPVKANGKVYHQLYMGRLVTENGKIKLLREALNTTLVTKAFSSDPE